MMNDYTRVDLTLANCTLMNDTWVTGYDSVVLGIQVY